MERIRIGWDLTKKAWGVVRTNPQLLKLPIFGGLLALLALVVFGAPAAALVAGDNPSQAAQIGAGALALTGMYLASYAVIFFNVALAASADQAFKGNEADTSYGIAIAKSRNGVIAAWALVAGLVSLFFAILRDRGGLAGQIAAGLGGAIWSLVTFLVIPVLAFEGIGPMQAIKRSTGLFKQRWGQQITGNAAIGIITFLFMLLGVALIVGGVFAAASGGVLLVLGVGIAVGGVVVMIAAAVASGAVRGVFGVALYHYVAENQLAGPFTQADLESVVKAKQPRGGMI